MTRQHITHHTTCNRSAEHSEESRTLLLLNHLASWLTVCIQHRGWLRSTTTGREESERRKREKTFEHDVSFRKAI